jgi:hypothetical protein
MAIRSRAWIATVVLASVTAAATLPAATSPGRVVSAPMVCSRGPADQRFAVILTLPPTAAEASTYAVRIDGVASGTISHVGLNYIHDMETDYVVPRGATYVADSAHVIAGTGTANVAAGARVWHDAGIIRVLLPGRVASGTGYTPPSVELELQASAPAGTSLPFTFFGYRVVANAFLVGDVHTTCTPTPRPYPLGATRVTAAEAPR